MRRLTKASIESLVDSCVELMLERDKTRTDVKNELLFEVDTVSDLYTVLGYFLERYGGHIRTGGEMPVIEQWQFEEGIVMSAHPRTLYVYASGDAYQDIINVKKLVDFKEASCIYYHIKCIFTACRSNGLCVKRNGKIV